MAKKTTKKSAVKSTKSVKKVKKTTPKTATEQEAPSERALIRRLHQENQATKPGHSPADVKALMTKVKPWTVARWWNADRGAVNHGIVTTIDEKRFRLTVLADDGLHEVIDADQIVKLGKVHTPVSP